MSTTIRPEVSKKNCYWIPKHRFYELKHFCLQFMDWQKERAALDSMTHRSTEPNTVHSEGNHSNPTERDAIERIRYSERIQLVMNAAYDTDKAMGDYILLGVTKGMSYDILRARYNIPCGKDMYYNLYRRFFWLLDKTRC